ncbi:MAG TPA: hypothetical protein VEY71_05335, partial [Chitinophagales bacterium]|nr:hypothetical protein [Chitinophagales bacterium]
FRVYFEQGTRVIEADDEVTLKKEPFDIVFEFPEPMDMLVHASFNSETYDLALGAKQLKKLPGFANVALDETESNEDNEMLLNATAPARWFYTDDENHSFDDAKEKSGKLTCKRRVVFFNEVDSNRVTEVTDVIDPLHLVFISTERGESDKEVLEIHRVPVRVQWEE